MANRTYFLAVRSKRCVQSTSQKHKYWFNGVSVHNIFVHELCKARYTYLLLLKVKLRCPSCRNLEFYKCTHYFFFIFLYNMVANQLRPIVLLSYYNNKAALRLYVILNFIVTSGWVNFTIEGKVSRLFYRADTFKNESEFFYPKSESAVLQRRS